MKMKLIFLITNLFLLMTVIGCATPYKEISKKNGYGYKEEKLNDRVYKITFEGNSHTSDELVYKYFMRRSAEVALANHSPYFTIIEANEMTKSTPVVSETSLSQADINPPNYTGDIYYRPFILKNISSHALVGKIALFKEKEKPANAIKVEEILKDVKY